MQYLEYVTEDGRHIIDRRFMEYSTHMGPVETVFTLLAVAFFIFICAKTTYEILRY